MRRSMRRWRCSRWRWWSSMWGRRSAAGDGGRRGGETDRGCRVGAYLPDFNGVDPGFARNAREHQVQGRVGGHRKGLIRYRIGRNREVVQYRGAFGRHAEHALVRTPAAHDSRNFKVTCTWPAVTGMAYETSTTTSAQRHTPPSVQTTHMHCPQRNSCPPHNFQWQSHPR